MVKFKRILEKILEWETKEVTINFDLFYITTNNITILIVFLLLILTIKLLIIL